MGEESTNKGTTESLSGLGYQQGEAFGTGKSNLSGVESSSSSSMGKGFDKETSNIKIDITKDYGLSSNIGQKQSGLNIGGTSSTLGSGLGSDYKTSSTVGTGLSSDFNTTSGFGSGFGGTTSGLSSDIGLSSFDKDKSNIGTSYGTGLSSFDKDKSNIDTNYDTGLGLGSIGGPTSSLSSEQDLGGLSKKDKYDIPIQTSTLSGTAMGSTPPMGSLYGESSSSPRNVSTIPKDVKPLSNVTPLSDITPLSDVVAPRVEPQTYSEAASGGSKRNETTQQRNDIKNQ